MTPSIDQTLHQFANLLPNWTLIPILTLLPNFGGFHRALQRVQLANRGRLLLRTPGTVPFGTAFVLMLRPFFPELVMSTDYSSFEHSSVLLFCLTSCWTHKPFPASPLFAHFWWHILSSVQFKFVWLFPYRKELSSLSLKGKRCPAWASIVLLTNPIKPCFCWGSLPVDLSRLLLSKPAKLLSIPAKDYLSKIWKKKTSIRKESEGNSEFFILFRSSLSVLLLRFGPWGLR